MAAFHSLDDVRAVVLRLFIASSTARLRKEDEQKSKELHALLGRLMRLRKGAHVVDAAAGKASVGLVAAELLPIGSLTVLARDPARVEACRAAQARLARAVPVDVRQADVGDASAWPEAPDAVVALHACGPAADAVLDQAIRVRTRFLFLVPCCYGATIPFAPNAARAAEHMGFDDEDLIGRRARALVIDLERKLRLEAAGYETEVDELVGGTVTPHNLIITARYTQNASRIARARARLDALRGSGAAT